MQIFEIPIGFVLNWFISNWFISNWTLGIGVIIGTILIVNIIFSTVRKYIHHDILKKHHEFAGYIIGVFGVLYSVFLGFIIVSSQENLNDVVSKIDEEAYLTATLLATTNAFPEETRINIQKKILAYLESVIKEEWPVMAKKMESPYTLMKLEEMQHAFYNFHPQTEYERLWYANAIEILSKQGCARLKRVYSTWECIGYQLWLSLIIGGVTLISFLFFFGAENDIAHRLLISFFSGYFAFMLFTVYALDNPFNDPIKIEPKAYEIIYNYKAKTHGTTISPEKTIHKKEHE